MAGSGGSQPVTLEAPVRASSRGDGRSVEAGDDVVHAEGAIGAALHVAARGHPAPGQKVGVMFDDGGEDDVVGVEPEPVGELVDGLGGVAAEDGDVVGAAGPRRRPERAARADS